ncbi:MAG: hypothetical protein GDA42_11495 [Ekhidna sp.]|nr:hypothetical protein [Ekhidna sp.]MBC6411056.1 hypothetical protein [Ekhidna sp.]
MQNDPELNPKYLGKISADFVKAAESLREASYAIRRQEFSKYPVFPMCQTEQSIGQMLIEAGQAENEWHYSASFMEEFVQRGLITDEELFQKNYKNPDEFCCLFVIDQEFTHFVFVPYPID